MVNIAANKNTIPSDKSALVPHGLRIGSPAMTTRGLKGADFAKIVEFIDQAVKLTIEINQKVTGASI
jgi:glycine hydroxymethyltransferase